MDIQFKNNNFELRVCLLTLTLSKRYLNICTECVLIRSTFKLKFTAVSSTFGLNSYPVSLTFKGPVFPNQTHITSTPTIHFIYLGNKEIYCIFRTCCIMFYYPQNSITLCLFVQTILRVFNKYQPSQTKGNIWSFTGTVKTVLSGISISDYTVFQISKCYA